MEGDAVLGVQSGVWQFVSCRKCCMLSSDKRKLIHLRLYILIVFYLFSRLAVLLRWYLENTAGCFWSGNAAKTSNMRVNAMCFSEKVKYAKDEKERKGK